MTYQDGAAMDERSAGLRELVEKGEPILCDVCVWKDRQVPATTSMAVYGTGTRYSLCNAHAALLRESNEKARAADLSAP